MSLEDRIKLAEMKSRHQKTLRPWYKKPWGKVLIGILALIMIIAALSFWYVINEAKRINQERADSQNLILQKQAEATLYGANNYYLGAGSPKLIIVEFSDFACPYCKQLSEVIRQAGEKYKDQVKIIFRDFPVISEKSIDLSQAAWCAGAQGKFWEMHDALFANQDSLKASEADLDINLRSLALDLKLNTDDFSACLNDKAYLDNIRANLEDGEALGVEKTPTWFIGRHRVTGHMEKEQFNALIEKYLNQ
ncbi:MAG: thioredoxin domain-containing protein [Patescibacteria group bacterium]